MKKNIEEPGTRKQEKNLRIRKVHQIEVEVLDDGCWGSSLKGEKGKFRITINDL